MHWDLDEPYQPHPTGPTPGAGTMNDEPWEHPNHYDASTKTTENSEALNMFLFVVEIYPHQRIHDYLYNIYIYTTYVYLVDFFQDKCSSKYTSPMGAMGTSPMDFLVAEEALLGGSYPLQKIHLFESMMCWWTSLWWDVFYLPGRVKNRCVNFKQHKPPMMKGEDGKFRLNIWRLIVSCEVRING